MKQPLVKNVVEMTFREWCEHYGYDEILNLIDPLIDEWKWQGKRTRRNWWDIFAGTEEGEPRTIDGTQMPILHAARVRKGFKAVKGALRRHSREVVPPISHQSRWDS